jgi:hypothetical protein
VNDKRGGNARADGFVMSSIVSLAGEHLPAENIPNFNLCKNFIHMDRKYWEKIAPGTSEEIFDVLQNDLKGIIRSAIRKTSSTSKTVLDAGCAVGKWLPLLSPLFKRITQ